MATRIRPAWSKIPQLHTLSEYFGQNCHAGAGQSNAEMYPDAVS